MTEEKLPQKPSREPQALSSEYHKARKQLMLWAGILFIWELVGIDLEKAREAGGNAGAIIGAIKSPQAVPWVLLVLVLYFVFKMRVEWGQCNKARRDVLESRMDYLSAFVVAGIAGVLYFGQTLSHVQFANAVQDSSKFNSFFVGAFVAIGVVCSGYFLWERFAIHTKKRNDLLLIAFGYSILPLIAIFAVLRRTRPHWPYVLMGASAILLILGPFTYLMGRKLWREHHRRYKHGQ